MISIKTSQAIASAPAVDAFRPTSDHGETADKPNPAPNASSIKYKAAATKAPPMTAPQDTPDECASRLCGTVPLWEYIKSADVTCVPILAPSAFSKST